MREMCENEQPSTMRKRFCEVHQEKVMRAKNRWAVIMEVRKCLLHCSCGGWEGWIPCKEPKRAIADTACRLTGSGKSKMAAVNLDFFTGSDHRQNSKRDFNGYTRVFAVHEHNILIPIPTDVSKQHKFKMAAATTEVFTCHFVCTTLIRISVSRRYSNEPPTSNGYPGTCS
jgi:hypothetical protein